MPEAVAPSMTAATTPSKTSTAYCNIPVKNPIPRLSAR
jgi:hypothetical protein